MPTHARTTAAGHMAQAQPPLQGPVGRSNRLLYLLGSDFVPVREPSFFFVRGDRVIPVPVQPCPATENERR